MDPPSLMSQGLFTSANASSFSLAEIWPFALNGVVGESTAAAAAAAAGTGSSSCVLGGSNRRNHFEQNLSGFRNLVDESTGTEGRKRRDVVVASAEEEDESSKLISATSDKKETKDFETKRLKSSRSGGEENEDLKTEMEVNSGTAGNKPAEQSTQTSEPPKQDFIHVRARRGQATDSHSLAERARREKISERMKILQDLVPGCNKVIGKALVLDEIINYIQSLQCQVEFLSMKLEAVNSGSSPSIEGFPLKDFGAQPLDSTGIAFGSQATREYGQGSSAEWLHMQVGGGFERAT